MAGFICAFACVSALGLFQRFRQAKDDRGWGLTLTAFVAGAGVWSTHFVAMLAYDPHLPMSFDVFGTATSLVYVILGMGVGFTLALRGTGGRVAGAIVAGLSIGAMHYAGILAVRLQGHIHWRPTFVVMSILVAVGLNIASFVALGPRPRRSRWAAAAALLMAEILSLHFTAMAAMSVTPDPTIALDGGSVERPVVAVAVTLVSLALLAAPFAVLAIEQRARRQMLSTLRRSLNAVPAGMAFFDERDRLTAWNAPWADVAHSLDLEPAEGLPRSVMLSAARTAGWIPPSDQDKDRLYDHLKGWRELAAADVRMPDGRWMRHQQFRLEGGGGVTTFTDVTAQNELVAALTTAKDAAEAANAAKTAFLANISHEIRTPLNGVLGAAELLGRRPLDLEEHKLVDMLQTSGRVLSDLLDEVLDLSRIEAGAIEIRPQPADLAALLADVRQVHAAAAAMKGIDLRLRIAEGAGERVECDANRLGQVLGNLLNNAIKFTDKGRVTLSAERDGASVTFRVSDTGIGFTAAQKRRLFERFSQADPSSTRARGGAGLGLAIAKELVALMGGDLDGVSRPGEGSTFDFTLDLPAIGTVDAAQPLQGPAHAGRVLIVDDNAINRQVLATILNATGIEYAEAADGAEALAAFGQESFSAILMDIQMPVMDGWEATRRIRDLERSTGRPRTPIFMVSANGLQGHVDASLAAGADDHFPKPVPIARLLAALEPCVEPVSKVA